MHITTPERITDLLYDVETVIPPNPHLLSAGSSREKVRIGIGRPFQWGEGEFLGEKWRPPAGGHRYYLVRLAFSIHCLGRTRPKDADFCIKLLPRNDQSGIIFDAYPRELLTEISHPVTLGVGADFKLGPAQVSLGKAETTIDFGKCVPTIESYGLQQSEFHWRYCPTDKHPIEGDRMMYAVIALPPGMPKTSASLQLSVGALNTSFTHLWLFMGGETYDSLNWEFGEVSADGGAATKADPDILWDRLYHAACDGPGPDRESVPDTVEGRGDSLSKLMRVRPRFRHPTESPKAKAYSPTDVYILANAGELEGAAVIYSTGGDDSFVLMSRLKEVIAGLRDTPPHAYDLWRGTIPGQPGGTNVYYRIQVRNGQRRVYLKAGGTAAGGYLNPFRQWVRENDAPDRDNYHFVVTEHGWDD